MKTILKFSLIILTLIILSIILYPVTSLKRISYQIDVKAQKYNLTKANLNQFIEYLKIPTIRGNEHLASLFLQRLFEESGLGKGHIIHLSEENRSIFYIELGQNKADKDGIILLNHTDVVEFDQNLWQYKQGEVHQDEIYGRGALDMKGLGFSQAIALIEYIKKNPNPKQKIMFLAVPDEETSSKGINFFIKNHRSTLSDYRYVLNEGGIGTLPGENLNKKMFNIQYAEKALLWIDAWSEFPPGHGSSPSKDYSTKNLILFLNDLVEIHQEVKITPHNETFLSQLANSLNFPGSFFLKRMKHPLIKPFVLEQFSNKASLMALLRDTLSITWLNSTLSLSYNRLPPKAKAKLDIRLLPDTSLDKYLLGINKLAKKYKVKIKIFQKKDSTRSNIDSPFFKQIQLTAQRLYPDAVIAPLISSGVTDSSALRKIGLECFGIIPTFIKQEKISSIHGVNESISKKQLEESIQFIINLLSISIKSQ